MLQVVYRRGRPQGYRYGTGGKIYSIKKYGQRVALRKAATAARSMKSPSLKQLLRKREPRKRTGYKTQWARAKSLGEKLQESQGIESRGKNINSRYWY